MDYQNALELVKDLNLEQLEELKAVVEDLENYIQNVSN